jgi:hypothetical protein
MHSTLKARPLAQKKAPIGKPECDAHGQHHGRPSLSYSTRPVVVADPGGGPIAGAVRVATSTSVDGPAPRSPFIPIEQLTAGERGIVDRWLRRHHPMLARQIALAVSVRAARRLRCKTLPRARDAN